MKSVLQQLLLSCFFLGVTFHSNSQITIESKNLLILNTKIVNAYDTISQSIDLGTTGAGQSWDFSNVTENDLDKDSVRKPTGTFGEKHFINADMAIDEGDSGFVYLSKNSTELVINGFSNLESNGDTSNQDLNMKIITFPSSLGTKFTDDADVFAFAFDLNIDPDGPGPHPFVDSLGVISSTSVYSEMDAEGSLKTKIGGYNALRQHFITYSVDSMFMHANGKWTLISPLMVIRSGNDSIAYDTSHTYRFWAEGVNFPVVEIEYDMEKGLATEIQWLKEIVVGLDNPINDLVQLKIYPNPVDDHLIIQTDLNQLIIEIRDIQGRRIEEKSISGNSYLKVSHLENGTYIFSVLNESGILLQSKMIQVLH